MVVYGYARVSSKDQNEERQLIALRNAGIRPQNVFVDKQSGKNFNRPGWKKLLKRLRRGDVIVVQSLDRLGRNYRDTLAQWRLIVEKRKANIRILDMPMLDTTSEDDTTIQALLSNIILHLLSYIAENERIRIRERQAQGIAAAKARGVRFGRHRRDLPEDFPYYANLVYNGLLSRHEAARRCGLSNTTFYRRFKEYHLCSVPPPTKPENVSARTADGRKVDVPSPKSAYPCADNGPARRTPSDAAKSAKSGPQTFLKIPPCQKPAANAIICGKVPKGVQIGVFNELSAPEALDSGLFLHTGNAITTPLILQTRPRRPAIAAYDSRGG